jgi:exopolysaccharide biosynthesis polyprenyl glycosylphosphotransferase
MIRLFRVSIPASVIFLLLSESILLLGFYLIATYFEFGDDTLFYVLDEGGLQRAVLVVVLVQAGLYLQDLYDDVRSHGQVLLVQQLCVVLGGAFLAQALLGYGHLSLQMHKWAMVYGSGLTLALLPLWRRAFYLFMRKAMPAETILFLGSSDIMKQIAERIHERPALGLEVAGYIDDEKAIGDFPFPHLGCLAELGRWVAQIHPGRIVVAKTERRGWLPMEKLLELRFAGIHIEEAAVLYESVFGRICTADVRPSQLVFSAELGPRPRNVSLQNVYSFVLGAAGLLISAPVLALVAILVKLSSPGPVFYRQTRVGFRGTTFQVFKFRSMYVDAEAHTGAVWATQCDPRITPIGTWLRRLRLDELPQFLNVIRGEMAVAGPRPERPEFCKILEEKIPFYKQRHSVKPGITGWAQINYPYADTIEDSITKLEYDLYYIKNLAPSLDAYIIFHTLKVMLLSRGSR